MSYNIVDHKGEILIEGIYCINSKYRDFCDELLLDVETGEKYSLDMLKAVLDPLDLFNSFLPILVFGFLTGNTITEQRKDLIGKYILSKVQLLKRVYRKEE